MGDESTAMSGMSGMSGVSGASEMGYSGASGDEQSDDHRGLVIGIVICLVAVALLGMVFFLVTGLGAGGDDSASEGGDEGGPSDPSPDPRPDPVLIRVTTGAMSTVEPSRTAASGPSTMSSPPTGSVPSVDPNSTATSVPSIMRSSGTSVTTRASVTKRATTAATMTQRRGTTIPTTTTPPPIKELICTTGAYVTQTFLYPPDGLCHYLFYSKLFIRSGTLHGTSDDSSWTLFKERVALYSKTKGGLDFDSSYVNSNLVTAAASNLNIHAQKGRNIQNYAVFDIMARGTELRSLLARARSFLVEIKKLESSSQRRQLFIGIGLYAFNEANGLTTYKNIFKEAVEDSVYYTVFAITSTSVLQPGTKCSVEPTGARFAQSRKYPAIEHLKDILTTNAGYKSKIAIVGVSLEMGALAYTLTKNFSGTPTAKLFNEDCDGAGITSPDTVCISHEFTDSRDGRVGKVSQTDQKHVIVMESEESIKYKVEINQWKNPDILKRFSWLVFNIQFDNSQGACTINSKFTRVRYLKSLFGIP